MADKFQPDFYVTCATVIPVLFLALAVQGRAYNWLLNTAEQVDPDRRVSEPVGDKPNVQRARPGLLGIRWMTSALVSWALLIIALLIVVLGGAGEALALYVLYRGSEAMGDRRLVLLATLALLIAVIAGPLLAVTGSKPPRSATDLPVERRKRQAGSPAGQP